MTRSAKTSAKSTLARTGEAPARGPSLNGQVLMSAFMTTITLAAFFFVLPIMLQQERDEIALKSRGVDATAEVLSTWSVPGGARSAPSYHARFTFHAGSRSSTVTDEAYTSRREFSRLRPGARAPIIFDPQHPSLAQLNFNDKVRRRHPIIENACWIALFFGIVALAWVGHILMFRQTLRERRAVQV